MPRKPVEPIPPTPAEIASGLLRVRAKIAVALGDDAAARVLRGYAETLTRDPRAVDRLRARLLELVEMFDEETEVTPVQRTWLDALGDIERALAAAPAPGEPAKVRPPSATRRDALADVVRAAVAPVKEALAVATRELADARAKLATLVRAQSTEPDALPDRLRAELLPDGRSWFDVAETIAGAAERPVPMVQLLKRERRWSITRTRAKIYAWLHFREGVTIKRIAEVWGYDRSSITWGIEHLEADEVPRRLAPAPTKKAA